VIAVEAISARIGAVEVLSDISFSVAPGALLAVLGANGAGKTSLLRSVSNLLPLSGGRVTYDGQDISGIAPHLLARKGLVHVPQGRQIVPTLSVLDNLLLGASHLSQNDPDMMRKNLEDEFTRFPVLRERQRIPGGSLSGGEQQMLALSRALMMRPKVLMLDEPSLGLAPQVARAILRALRSLTEQGVAVILVEQIAIGALKIADNGLVLRNGQVALRGSATELLADRGLVESYLG
jgi:branched-chain amino acid transport system ATP-binding protein